MPVPRNAGPVVRFALYNINSGCRNGGAMGRAARAVAQLQLRANSNSTTSSPNAAANNTERTADIVILGAGVSGLAAAQQIRASIGSAKPSSTPRNPRVTVLEARHRVLGRLHSGTFEGRQVELGAQWLFADSTRKTALEGWLEEAGITYKEWKADVRTVKAGEGSSLPTAKGNQPIEALRTGLADVTGTNLIFPSGLEDTFKTLAEGVDIRFGEAVSGIRLIGPGESKDGKRVKISTSKGDFTTNFVVCALPLPILRSLTFTPSLPPTTQSFISPSRLRTRFLEKLILSVKDKGLLEALFNGPRNLRLESRDGKFTLVDLRAFHPDSQGVMLFFTDLAAQKFVKMDSEEAKMAGTVILAAAAAGVGESTPRTAGAVGSESLQTSWCVDPYSMGAFTTYLGDKNGYAPIPPLEIAGKDGESESWLVFAGEHTPPSAAGMEDGVEGGGWEQMGTVQGAWMSGIRAGEEVALEWLSSEL